MLYVLFSSLFHYFLYVLAYHTFMVYSDFKVELRSLCGLFIFLNCHMFSHVYITLKSIRFISVTQKTPLLKTKLYHPFQSSQFLQIGIYSRTFFSNRITRRSHNPIQSHYTNEKVFPTLINTTEQTKKLPTIFIYDQDAGVNAVNDQN